jgi:hypothetical protein
MAKAAAPQYSSSQHRHAESMVDVSVVWHRGDPVAEVSFEVLPLLPTKLVLVHVLTHEEGHLAAAHFAIDELLARFPDHSFAMSGLVTQGEAEVFNRYPGRLRDVHVLHAAGFENTQLRHWLKDRLDRL